MLCQSPLPCCIRIDTLKGPLEDLSAYKKVVLCAERSYYAGGYYSDPLPGNGL